MSAGCASNTGPTGEERRYERIDYQARFLDFRAKCLARDKRIFIDARSRPPLRGIPEPGDRYYCY